MRRGRIEADGTTVPLIECAVCIVGSGAAGLNAAVHLVRLGVKDVVIVTERLGGGASANAGSDKQTYCRVNPAAEGGDGVAAMADDLFSGGAMHGDTALVEAALSEREFYHLVELGVEFPHDRYGVYPGFRTDHDSAGRGTSAGPGTSIAMYERLAEEAARLGVPIIDGWTVVEAVTEADGGAPRISGLLGLSRPGIGGEGACVLSAVAADYVIYAVGGPGGLFRDSVYPPDQVGGLGAPLAAGVAAVNLTESQFGIASTGFRWNLSGSYQQVVARYVSTSSAGGDEREFLNAGFPDPGRLFTAQFLKGYQWPFDVKKLSDFGSSLVDALVFDQTVRKGRHAFIDFSRNPAHGTTPFSMESAPEIVRHYLARSGAAGDTPIDRLRAMNGPACDVFLNNGIDLAHARVPIAVCHQHVNGGLAVSDWWETGVGNLFAVGECCGSHGIYRPGGAALNAGQVGSLRAAQMIAHRIGENRAARRRTRAVRAAAQRLAGVFAEVASRAPRIDPVREHKEIGRRMSAVMGIVRNVRDVTGALEENRQMIEAHRSSRPADPGEITAFVKNADLLVTERAFLASAKFLLGALSGPRGSFLVGDADAIENLATAATVGRSVAVVPDESKNDRVVECALDRDLSVRVRFVPVRPLVRQRPWFERTWAEYRSGAVYDETPMDGGER